MCVLPNVSYCFFFFERPTNSEKATAEISSMLQLFWSNTINVPSVTDPHANYVWTADGLSKLLLLMVDALWTPDQSGQSKLTEFKNLVWPLHQDKDGTAEQQRVVSEVMAQIEQLQVEIDQILSDVPSVIHKLTSKKEKPFFYSNAKTKKKNIVLFFFSFSQI